MKPKEQQKEQNRHNKEGLNHQTNRSGEAKILEFFNSPIPIIIVLIIFVIFLLFYNSYTKKSTTLYNFGGQQDNFSIYSGTIYISRDINYFGDSKINYTGDDIKLYNFEIGYYIKNGEEYNEISITSTLADLSDEGASLKNILASTDFTFTEAHKESKHFSKNNLNNISNLVFRIRGKDKKGDDVNIEIPLEVNKISK